jgi:nicotinic acid mononucleotide adenylyltransferase
MAPIDFKSSNQITAKAKRYRIRVMSHAAESATNASPIIFLYGADKLTTFLLTLVNFVDACDYYKFIDCCHSQGPKSNH